MNRLVVVGQRLGLSQMNAWERDEYFVDEQNIFVYSCFICIIIELGTKVHGLTTN